MTAVLDGVWILRRLGDFSQADRFRRNLLSVWFCAREPFFQECNLSGLVRLVFADVEPLAQVVGGPPGPILVDGHQPGIVALAELRQRFRAGFLQNVQIVVPVCPLMVFRPASPRLMAASHCCFTESGQLPHFLSSNVWRR